MGACVLLACVGALWMARVAAAPVEAPVDPGVALINALRTSEFATLEAKTAADGRLTLRGRLATQVQRAQLDAWLAERRMAPVVEVWVDEAIARDVTEVFRVNGVRCARSWPVPAASPPRPWSPMPTSSSAPTDVVRRDVRGLQTLDVHNSAKPLPPPAPPVSDDPGKRIASLVPGDPAYLVTADGSRYFVGAVLPTGHRITQIDKSRVTLERTARRRRLNL